MDIFEFYKLLAQKCEWGKCERCGAREFCFTAPRSVTEELINQVCEYAQTGGHTRKDGQTH